MPAETQEGGSRTSREPPPVLRCQLWLAADFDPARPAL